MRNSENGNRYGNLTVLQGERIMPTIVRKLSRSSVMEVRREILHSVTWQMRSSLWSPPTDVYETEEAFVVRVEIAGMLEDEFEIAFENNVLMITGYRSDRLEHRAYHQMEIRFGKFATSVGLARPVDVDHATAQYTDGFLTVTFPKAKPNQVRVE